MSTDMFPQGFIDHVLEHHRQVEERMIRAYGTALAASHGFGSVSIHVGQDGWDWCRRQVEKTNQSLAETLGITGAKAWGFPILLEPQWPADRVEIRTTEAIA